MVLLISLCDVPILYLQFNVLEKQSVQNQREAKTIELFVPVQKKLIKM